jgi:hypothetical protein
MKHILLTAVVAVFAVQPAVAETYIVENGKPRAEIVIAKRPQRMTRMAAAEFQTYVEKITGAKLSIVTQPSGTVPVRVYVGRSSHTDKLGITAEGLKHGAYRIASGDNWLVLIGDDTDFVPREPWARNNADRASGRHQRQWEEASGESLGVPNGGMYKHRRLMPAEVGLPDGAEPSKERIYFWGFDERGSFNAVCGFLRGLGVRWYLPGDLGEVLPEMKSIPLPKIDETVRPDFTVRRFNVRFSYASEDTMKWAMHLGMRDPYGLMVAHGMHTMTHTEAVMREHPKWFALYGGKRDVQPDKRLHHLCYSNEELFQATVRWARAQFDVYDFDSVSIMPPDAYISICQCDLCKGKELPEMGARGKLSNHVWDFVNRVAKEVGKTHPNKKILCCAYGANTDPPTNIGKLQPNVQVMIVGGRRPRNSKPEQRAPIRKLRESWRAKTDNPLMVFENYPFTDRGFYLPAFVARTIGESINATKGISRGEDIWLSFGRDFDTAGIGFNHFQVYFTARMYWGGKQQDAGAMLDEYCRLFYGPAGPQMRAFFEYCEDNWQDMEHDKKKVDTALKMFAAAQAKVDSPGGTGERARPTIHAKRLALIDEFLAALRSKAEQLGQKRGPVPKLRTVWEATDIVIDGKLDEEYWQNCPTSSSGRLRELQTGRQPIFGTTIKAGWDRHGDNLYLGIRCEERPGEELNIATTKNEDQAMWYGDAVEIELDTDSHCYYQIAVNPAGALIDLDRGADKSAWYRWQSQAEVATHVAEDHWTVEIRIPVTDDDNDPLNRVVGRKPSQSLPWHINICRQRVRANGSEYSAFSPTGVASYHAPMKFAHFYEGRSHAFDADATVNDYLIASQAAAALERGRKYADALAAYVALAEGDKVTDLQKSRALEHAARCARTLKDFSRADELAAKIPLDAVAKTVRMENLLGQRKFDAISEQFGDEKLSQWPFWQVGAGAFARARAYIFQKAGEKAEADLQTALAYTADKRNRISILFAMGNNRETNLQDNDAALVAYRQNYESQERIGAADQFRSVQNAARILSRQGKFDEALATLRHVDFDKLRGYWRGSMLLALGETLASAGRKDQALTTYRTLLADESVDISHRKEAEEKIRALESEEE